MEVANPIVPDITIPSFIRKKQLREMCLDAEGNLLRYDKIRQFIVAIQH